MWRWEERIEQARQRTLLGAVPWRRFTREERRLAADWSACAVGEVRRRYGVRLDRNLERLGMAFFRAVVRNDVDGAATTRHTIEEHAVRSKGRQWESARGRRRQRRTAGGLMAAVHGDRASVALAAS